LRKFKAEDSKVLLVAEKLSQNAKKSSRNIESFCYTTAEALHPYELLWADKAFITLAAAKKIEEALV
jgi:ribosomal protein L4